MRPEDLRSLAYVESMRQQARTATSTIRLKHRPEELWPFVSNTDMVNAQTAMPQVQITARPTGVGGSELTVQSTEMGLPIRYEELPYEWNAPEKLLVERLFEQGPVAYYCFASELKPLSDGGTEAVISVSVVSKLPWFLIRGRLQMILERMANVYKKMDSRAGRPASLGVEAFLDEPANHRDAITRLESRWSSLSQNPRIARCLAEYIYTAPDRYVRKLRPFELAEFYQLDPMETLQFCLKATKTGFLNLSWDLICPGCQGSKAEASSLSEVNPDAHCEFCDLDFSVSLDQNFELTFHPVLTVRSFIDAPFCAGSPSNTSHFVMQKNLWSGQTEGFRLLLGPGRYRFRTSAINGWRDFEIHSEGKDRLTLEPEDLMTLERDPAKLAYGCRLTFKNTSPHFQTLRIENLSWRSQRVSAALVSTLQEFRDSFSSEVLRPGIQLSVSNLTVMFSDLKDSTRMYEARGDAAAFSLVHDHFEIMQALIREYQGAVVKTIGDAVMAVFQDPAKALACALKIQETFQQRNQQEPERPIILKLGLHRGSSIALNLNQRLDYFGSTINKAARIQSESIGEDIVLSDEMLSADGVSELLTDYQLEPFEKNLKGLSGQNKLYRLLLS